MKNDFHVQQQFVIMIIIREFYTISNTREIESRYTLRKTQYIFLPIFIFRVLIKLSMAITLNNSGDVERKETVDSLVIFSIIIILNCSVLRVLD